LALALSANVRVINRVDWSVHTLGIEFTEKSPLYVMIRAAEGVPRLTTRCPAAVPPNMWRTLDAPGYQWVRVYDPQGPAEESVHQGLLAECHRVSYLTRMSESKPPSYAASSAAGHSA
jgi:hypothetical protein